MSSLVRSNLLALVVVAACGGTPPSPSDPDGGGGNITWHWPEGLSAATPQSAYSRSAPIPVVFHNGSGQPVTVGALGCTAWLERRNGDAWVPLVSTRLCIQLAVVVEQGYDLPFTVDSPGAAGSYRIAFQALLDGHQETVRSGVFTVR